MNAEHKSTEDVLFDFLKNTLYNPKKAILSADDLPQQYQKLGIALITLQSFIEENKAFVSSLAQGKLSVTPPSGENVIAGPAKALHSALLHLSWQASRIARGDYSQRVQFLGDFSAVFNAMVESIDTERESEREKIEYAMQRNRELAQFQTLFLEVAATNKQLILVCSCESKKILYSNAEHHVFLKPSVQKLLLSAAKKEFESLSFWEYYYPELCPTEYFKISSHNIVWNGEQAIAHIISDITLQKETFKEMEALIYQDTLTKCFNRRYSMLIIRNLIEQDKSFCIAYVDIDRLKYCNDTFGHVEGNNYILSVSNMLLNLPFEKTVCRNGGDEFVIIAEHINKTTLESVLYKQQELLHQENSKPEFNYIKSFSFGTEEYRPFSSMTLTELLQKADQNMYEQKKENTKKLKSLLAMKRGLQ